LIEFSFVEIQDANRLEREKETAEEAVEKKEKEETESLDFKHLDRW
jgi:hypothetical protein